MYLVLYIPCFYNKYLQGEAIITTLATVQITQKLNIETNTIEFRLFVGACILGVYFPYVNRPSSH